MDLYPITTAMLIFLIEDGRILLKQRENGRIGGFYFHSNGKIDIRAMLSENMENLEEICIGSLIHVEPASIGENTVFVYKCKDFIQVNDTRSDHKWFDFCDIPYDELEELDHAVISHLIRDEALPKKLFRRPEPAVL